MKTILLLLMTLFVTSAYSQSEEGIKGNIVGKGKPYTDRITLRWNVDNYQVFKQLTVDGVWVDRLTLGSDNKPEGSGWVRITPTPVKALPLEQLQKAPYATDTAAAVVAEGLYAKNDYPELKGLVELLKIQDLDRQNRHMMVSLYAALSKAGATAGGLGFDDNIQPEQSKSYVYRISPVKPQGISGTIAPGFIYVAGSDAGRSGFYSGLDTESGEKSISISWPKVNSPFTGYFIERSRDKKKFERLNRSIYLPSADGDSLYNQKGRLYYLDSVANYVTYYYRLVGVDAFGDQVLFADTVRGMAEDFTAPEPPLFHVEKEGGRAKFSWNRPADTDTKGYFLLRGKTVSANDALVEDRLLSAGTLRYELKLPEKFRSSFYRLMVVDTAGNSGFSNPVYVFEPDVDPPAPPAKLWGNIDTTGLVTVGWALDTTEEALRGYKVFVANQDDHQYIPVSDIVPDTLFTYQTSLQTLSRKLYIKVVAIDGNYNHSPLSKALVLSRPDTIPPVAPQILDYRNTAGAIWIKWSDSRSEDLMENILYRRKAGESVWGEIFRAPSGTEYTDSLAVPGSAYEYSLRAVDSSGLFSAYAFPLHVRTSFAAAIDSVQLTGSYDPDEKMVKLEWNKSGNEVRFVMLYKNQGQGLEMYKSLPADTRVFSEKNSSVPKDNYAIRLKYSDDMESELIICR